MIATVGSGAGGAAAPGFQYKHLQANESIQAFLRSFLHEKHRWNELVEATLLYGIHCISQNYSLQTLNVDQVQHITRVSCEQQFCLHDFLDLGHRDMDEWTHVLGKPWVDAAWQAFVTTTGYPVPAATASDSTVSASFRDLRDSIVAKAPSTGVVNTHITSNEGHLSFLDYLRGFVVYCPMSKIKHMLDKQKQHVLRVRKTNTQRMHEALAKSRIAAYEPPVRRPAIPPPQPSLATTGPDGSDDADEEDGKEARLDGGADAPDPAFEWLVHEGSSGRVAEPRDDIESN
ncbi:hypothetical protein DYB32_007096 [Aphanomyces invadans]|uniref:Uncharacterized protein n=1 Tax=Aphanomyces invadans TaxID=157072 RepID=A0A3R7CX68_9STRA|nr:hypothetical protein DYB32_007096 [Aphanomyces invadans]